MKGIGTIGWKNKIQLFYLLAVYCAIFIISSCGDPILTFETNDSKPSTSPPDPPLEATYASIKANIFEKRCISCHSGAGSGHDVPLSPKEKMMSSPREIIIPGNSEESGLIIALTRSDDKRMPSKSDPLTEEQIATIKKWIDDGASK